ncbi:ATP-dependent serine protease [Prevotella sp. HMSC069G02]|nr:ATP-dependent serine protease [Prevotella sp. HMSC069G02]
MLRRALSVSDVLRLKRETYAFEGAWAEAFGQPEQNGVWFVWGGSGNGKTSFVLQLCKELSRFGRVAYDSLEEGASLTMQNAFVKMGMQDVARRFVLLDREDMELLDARLGKRKSPDIVVIDSFQYTGMTFRDYQAFKERHADKLLIFISQADGSKPAGRTAVSVMYDAALKIFVSGYRAISKGRYFGTKGYYTIWEERARLVYGDEEK